MKRVKEAAKSDEDVMPILIEAVKAYATVGEISDAFREIFKEYRQPNVL